MRVDFDSGFVSCPRFKEGNRISIDVMGKLCSMCFYYVDGECCFRELFNPLNLNSDGFDYVKE